MSSLHVRNSSYGTCKCYTRIGHIRPLNDASALRSEHSDSSEMGVVREITLSRLASKWDETKKEWQSKDDKISSVRRSHPFLISSPGNPTVQVPQNLAHNISTSVLTTIAEKFTPADTSAVLVGVIARNNENPIGTKLVERMALLGTEVTGVGKVHRNTDTIGSSTCALYQLSSVQNGSAPSILSNKPFGELILDKWNNYRFLRWIFLGSLTVTGVLIFKRIYKYYINKHRVALD